MLRTVITGTGRFIPPVIKNNEAFVDSEFYGEDGKRIEVPSALVVNKFRQITGIDERRYVSEDMTTSCIGAEAARKALEDSGTDPETIDYLIVAHNYGDIKSGSHQSDAVPSLAARIKHRLGIHNPSCVAYDILFGCPGWIQALIQANIYIRAGEAKRCLVVAAEALSRVIDSYDRDSMIFSDGAGACVVEGKEDNTGNGSGILSTASRSDCTEEVYYIDFGHSNNPEAVTDLCYIKMKGRKVYEYALKHVPDAMKECLDKSGVSIGELKKIFIHQANEKMDDSIVKAFYKLYDTEPPAHVMPMSIHWLGNSSVATIPTLLDLVRKGEMENQQLREGDVILFASVGAGMNINAVCYRY